MSRTSKGRITGMVAVVALAASFTAAPSIINIGSFDDAAYAKNGNGNSGGGGKGNSSKGKSGSAKLKGKSASTSRGKSGGGASGVERSLRKLFGKDKKVSRGLTYLVTDGGLHHHLSASGNFGQVIRKNYPAAIGNRMTATEKETAIVVGPLCTPMDVLADKMALPVAQPGHQLHHVGMHTAGCGDRRRGPAL